MILLKAFVLVIDILLFGFMWLLLSKRAFSHDGAMVLKVMISSMVMNILIIIFSL